MESPARHSPASTFLRASRVRRSMQSTSARMSVTLDRLRSKRVVTDFIEGEWREKSSVFVLCTQESMRSTTRAQEIETQAQILATYGVSFQQWGREELSLQLKTHPEIVDDFFGRPWVEAFCGTEAAQSLDERLDSSQRRRLRRELCSRSTAAFLISMIAACQW